jgi:hypothetical protein
MYRGFAAEVGEDRKTAGRSTHDPQCDILDHANRFAVAGFAGRIRLLQNRLEMVR